ncbi:hypothetical protein KBC04_00660 [Candidatus Babeliales bacterium]|nr:hypothetical protein [Candidatus Babeliales bacterium]MBP9843397.1 hypothetical protein [Candidatus Babeliales bacterium]
MKKYTSLFALAILLQANPLIQAMDVDIDTLQLRDSNGKTNWSNSTWNTNQGEIIFPIMSDNMSDLSETMSEMSDLSETNSVTSEASNDSSEKNRSEQEMKLDRSYTQKAQQIINESFMAMDTWMDKSMFKSKSSKIQTAYDYMSKSLKDLGTRINASTQSMNAVKNAVDRAFSMLISKTTPDQIQNDIIRKTVNATKILLLTPVKYAVIVASEVGGGAAGAVGGAGVGLATGIYRNSREFSNISFRKDGQINLTSVADALPKVIYQSVKLIVSPVALAAYGAAEGLFVGMLTGSKLAFDAIGNPLKLSNRYSQIKNNDFLEEIKAEAERFKILPDAKKIKIYMEKYNLNESQAAEALNRYKERQIADEQRKQDYENKKTETTKINNEQKALEQRNARQSEAEIAVRVGANKAEQATQAKTSSARKQRVETNKIARGSK